MQVFKNSFKALQDMLNARVTGIRLIDLWNEEVDMYREEYPQFCPAVYVEFTPVQWKTIGNKSMQHGYGSIKFHIVQNFVTDTASVDGVDLPTQVNALTRFELPQKVHEALQLFASTYFDNLDRVSSETDHNHDGLIIDVIEYAAIFRDDIANNVNNPYNADASVPNIDIEPNTVPAVTPGNNTGGYEIKL